MTNTESKVHSGDITGQTLTETLHIPLRHLPLIVSWLALIHEHRDARTLKELQVFRNRVEQLGIQELPKDEQDLVHSIVAQLSPRVVNDRK